MHTRYASGMEYAEFIRHIVLAPRGTAYHALGYPYLVSIIPTIVIILKEKWKIVPTTPMWHTYQPI